MGNKHCESQVIRINCIIFNYVRINFDFGPQKPNILFFLFLGGRVLLDV